MSRNPNGTTAIESHRRARSAQMISYLNFRSRSKLESCSTRVAQCTHVMYLLLFENQLCCPRLSDQYSEHRSCTKKQKRVELVTSVPQSATRRVTLFRSRCVVTGSPDIDKYGYLDYSVDLQCAHILKRAVGTRASRTVSLIAFPKSFLIT